MSNVSFRRGGLFDPMMIDSGQTLSNNAGMFANSLGKPTFDPDSPDAWKAQAAKLQSMGDTRGAVQALSMSQALQQQAQARRDKLQPVHSTAQSRASNFLTGARAEAKEKADVEKLATIAKNRFGEETAELVRMLPKDQAIQLIRQSSQGPKKSPKLIKEVGEDGNTYNVIVDQNNPEDKQVLGIASLGVSKEDQDKKSDRAENQTKSAENVLRLVQQARDLTDSMFASGFGSGAARMVSGSSAKDLEAKLTAIKGNLGFDRLQEMREASPTGGALGQVAVQELNALQSTVDSLDQSQSDEQLRAALDAVENHYNNWIETLQPMAFAEEDIERTGKKDGRRVYQLKDGRTVYSDGTEVM